MFTKFFRNAWLVLDPFSATGFDIARIALANIGVPGLDFACLAIQVIYESVNDVSIHREECIALCMKCCMIVQTIDKHHTEAKESNLTLTVQETNKICGDIKTDVEIWRNISFWRSWLLRNEIAENIARYNKALERCVPMLGLALALETNATVERVEDKVQEGNDKLDAVQKQVDRVARNISKLQNTLLTSSPDSSQYAEASKKILRIRGEENNGKKNVLPPAELKGECVMNRDKLISGSTLYDIYEGVWLGSIPVAMKGLRGERMAQKDMARITRQIDIWRSMDSPNVLRLLGYTMMDDRIYLVSPFYKNRDVKYYLRKCPDADRLKIIYGMAKGLEYLAGINVGHGAVQPSNVLIKDDGSALLADFALAKLYEGDGNLIFTQSGGNVMSLRYQAPEVSDGDVASVASDVWSWAMTAIEVLSDLRPYPNVKAPGQLARVITIQKLKPKREDMQCSILDDEPELWKFFERCWETDPVKRPKIEEVVRTMRPYVEDP